MARNQGSCSARPRGWGWEWSRGGAPRPGSPAQPVLGAKARSQRGRREGCKSATTPGLLRSRSPGPEGTCSLFRPLPDSCAGGWTRSSDSDDSSSSEEYWSAGSNSSSHASSDIMDLSFMAAQVTRNLPHAPWVAKFSEPRPLCPSRCSSSVRGQVLCPEPGSPTWCAYPGPAAWLSWVKWLMSLTHRRWSGAVSLEHPTSEQNSSEEPGELKSPLPAQPPPTVLALEPRDWQRRTREELPSLLWFCLALALYHLLVSSGQPPFSPLWVRL